MVLASTNQFYQRQNSFIRTRASRTSQTRGSRRSVTVSTLQHAGLGRPLMYAVAGRFVISYRPNDNPIFDQAVCRGRTLCRIGRRPCITRYR